MREYLIFLKYRLKGYRNWFWRESLMHGAFLGLGMIFLLPQLFLLISGISPLEFVSLKTRETIDEMLLQSIMSYNIIVVLVISGVLNHGLFLGKWLPLRSDTRRASFIIPALLNPLNYLALLYAFALFFKAGVENSMELTYMLAMYLMVAAFDHVIIANQLIFANSEGANLYLRRAATMFWFASSLAFIFFFWILEESSFIFARKFIVVLPAGWLLGIARGISSGDIFAAVIFSIPVFFFGAIAFGAYKKVVYSPFHPILKGHVPDSSGGDCMPSRVMPGNSRKCAYEKKSIINDIVAGEIINLHGKRIYLYLFALLPLAYIWEIKITIVIMVVCFLLLKPAMYSFGHDIDAIPFMMSLPFGFKRWYWIKIIINTIYNFCLMMVIYFCFAILINRVNDVDFFLKWFAISSMLFLLNAIRADLYLFQFAGRSQREYNAMLNETISLACLVYFEAYFLCIIGIWRLTPIAFYVLLFSGIIAYFIVHAIAFRRLWRL